MVRIPLAALVLATAGARTLAVAIYWCLAMNEGGLAVTATNAGGYIAAAWVLTLGGLAAGARATGLVAGLFRAGDLAVAAGFGLFAMLGGIPLGFVGLEVAAGPGLTAAGLLAGAGVLQSQVIQHGRVEAPPPSRAWTGAALASAAVAGLVGFMGLYAHAGYRVGQADLPTLKARAFDLAEAGQSVQDLTPERRDLVILALGPDLYDPGQRVSGFRPCATPSGLARRLTFMVTDGRHASGFGALWREGYRTALAAGLPAQTQLSLFVAQARMGRVVEQGQVKPINGVFEASQHYFARTQAELSDGEFFQLWLAHMTNGAVVPDRSRETDRYYVSIALARLEAACADPAVNARYGRGCALVEAQRDTYSPQRPRSFGDGAER